jgi:GT2 family glycosyltransferase
MAFPWTRRAAQLDGAAWLSDRILLLHGPLGDLGTDPVVTAQGAGPATRPEAHALSYDVRGDDAGTPRTALLLVFAAEGSDAHSLETRAARRRVRISAQQLTQATTDLRALVGQLARADGPARLRLQSMIAAGSAAELARTGSYALAQNLQLVHVGLRPSIRTQAEAQADRHSLHVDRVLAIDDRSFWLRGWAGDRITEDVRVAVVTPEGMRVDPLAGAHRHARADVDQFFAGAKDLAPGVESGTKYGFVRFLELDVPSLIPTEWVAELTDSAGEATAVETPPVTTDLDSVRNGIMKDIGLFARLDPGDELLREHALPALTKLHDRLSDSARIDTVMQYGEPVRSPDVSVIVPLYGRTDFMEHQLCQFVHDAEFREVDLIYVLDSPDRGGEFERSAAALHALYELPFRTAVLNRNAGFAIANNLGASLARGRLLVLLNSDVIPDSRGWVRTMAAFHDATPAIGALGPKLLYEDGSLQHAGMYFERDPGALWGNLHYFKGLESHFQPANVARSVPAVTGACLMVERSLWEQVGGLQPGYVQGGYEDSDLCLRLIEAGRDNWYLPSVALHHLEDQSFPSEARTMATAYNLWLQTHRWGARIEELMGEERFSAAV